MKISLLLSCLALLSAAYGTPLRFTGFHKVGNVICPGGQSECPTGDTCCLSSGGQYGCCPLPNAECCSDHVHCCPSGYTCDVSAGTCNKQGEHLLSLTKKTQAKPVEDPEFSVTCPDGQSQCPDGNTCCKQASGQYGCCPLPDAVCCSDQVHCCPSGYTCDVSAGTCNKQGEHPLSLTKKTQAKPVEDSEFTVMCPDGQSQCPDGNTCCKLASGQYGCCPLPQAVCCSDNIHCCPSGYTCDVSAGTCNKQGEHPLSLTKKTQAKPVEDPKFTVTCPDGQSQCPDGNTCCKLASGQYGCCPLPQAVCCSDNIHCCPSGYTCDVSAGTCNKGKSVVPFFLKSQAERKSL